MKTLILLAVLLSASFSQAQGETKRSNSLVRFLVENSLVRNLGLQSLMNNRCSTYFNYFEGLYCQEILSHMMTHLDIDMIVPKNKMWRPSAFVFVAFKKDFLEILDSPNTTLFLRKANEELSQEISQKNKNSNLWSLALKFYGTKYKAAQAMATLFQDTSSQRLHIGYLYLSRNLRKSQTFQVNQELLERLLSTISMILDYREDDFQTIFYPRELKEELNRNIYHFYVPLYLSMKLKRLGVQDKYAVMAPFMMTISYEFITYGKGANNLYSDPLIITREGTLKDIFGGYCGANYGLYDNRFSRSFPELKRNFSRSTHMAIDQLFRQY